MKLFFYLKANFILLFLAIYSNAQQVGGGNLNPGIYTNAESIKNFQDIRIGLSIHWGPSSIGAEEISWSRGKQIPKNEYDNYYKEFNPTKFNADEWVQLAKDGGIKYIILTSKHHDGFALWHSAVTDYDIENTPFQRDIVDELSKACSKNDVLFGSYYSIIDWYHPDYQPYDHGGPGNLFKSNSDTPNFERYIIFMKRQLQELIQNYNAQIIQLDGEWDSTWNHQLGSDLYLYLRKLEDKVLVNSRADVGRFHIDPKVGLWDNNKYAGDFDERERMVDWVKEKAPVYGKTNNPWQAWVTIDKAQWSWNNTPKLLSANEIILDMLKTIGDNGNYLINLGPRPDGTFHPQQVSRIKKVGAWINQHKEGIYGSRGGPFSSEARYTSTIKDRVVYLFVLDAAIKRIELNTSEYTILNVTDYQGDNMKYTTENDSIKIQIPIDNKELARVLKIMLKH